MKIVKLQGKGKVSIVETKRPECTEDSVVIQVKASALCGSELHALKELPQDNEFFNGGHEVVGVIVEAAANSPFKVGKRVGACVVQGCGVCAYCQAGYETACSNKSYNAGNAHAEYFRLGIAGVRPIPDDVDWPGATLLTGDGLGVPARAASRLGETRGKKVLVIGLGPIGLGCVLVQGFKGAKVMGVDLSEYRIALSKELGAERSANVKDEGWKESVMDWSEGKGADIVILAVPKNEALLNAIELVAQQGIVFQVAEFEEATINPSAAFVRKEITMTGSWYYTSADWTAMLAMQKQGLELTKLITHIFPFEEAQKAFDTFTSGKSGKVVLQY